MRIMEGIWLLVGLLSLIAGIHAWTHHDLKKSLIFFLMVFIAIFMFTFRRKLRKNDQKTEKK